MAGLAPALLSGCVSARYQAAPKKTPPPVIINLTAADPLLSAVLHTVVVYQGPGSWKRNAYWDEYVFSFTNHGATPMVLRDAQLFDFTQTMVNPGDNPWKVEKLSRSDLDRLMAAAGTTMKLGSATFLVVTAGAFPIVGVALTGGATAGAAAAVAAVALVPAFLVGTWVRNSNQRGIIEQEFTRRRLVLPLELAPGETRQGSLFFRIAPGPTHLSLPYDMKDGESGTLDLSLAPLASLHLTKPRPARERRAPPEPKPPRDRPDESPATREFAPGYQQTIPQPP